ncbi:MAG: thioether cross-link-forming SCIFF peptide maturase, partial [Christensenellales bacterium]
LEVDFFGGEPMMNFDVVKRIVAYGRELEKTHNKKFRFTITTNCYDVPADAPDFCDREMHNVVLSLDGRKNVHDAVRPVHGGGGSYDRAVENARKLVAHRQDKDYYARGTFTKRNLDFAEDAEALFDAGFEHISIEPVVLEKGHPLAITEEDLPGIEAEYERLMLNVYKRKKEGRPYNFFHFMIDLSGGPCLRKRLSGCGAGREYMAVTPEGDLYPCHQFVGREQYRIGNLDDESLDESVRDRFLDNHVGKKEACRTCWAQYLCAGGCAANAEAYSGSILQPNPQECRLLKKRTECALALMTLA